MFSPYKEPLLDAYTAVKETGRSVMVTLSETWLRNHQVRFRILLEVTQADPKMCMTQIHAVMFMGDTMGLRPED